MKFVMGCKKNMSFLMIPKSPKVFRKVLKFCWVLHRCFSLKKCLCPLHGITGGRGRGRVPETSDQEISVDLPGKERQGKWKRENGAEKKENWKREGDFFFFLLFAFSKLHSSYALCPPHHWKFLNLSLQGYLKTHSTNPRLVGTHLNVFFIQNLIMVIKLNSKFEYEFSLKKFDTFRTANCMISSCWIKTW